MTDLQVLREREEDRLDALDRRREPFEVELLSREKALEDMQAENASWEDDLARREP